MFKLSDEEQVVLEAPRDPDLARLHEYWNTKRGARMMPSRADVDPAEIGWILPDVYLIEVVPPPELYRTRLAGGNLIEFYGKDYTGHPVLEPVPSEMHESVLAFLDHIIESRTPIFVAGRVNWFVPMRHKHFESCLMPLSADGVVANMILGATKTKLAAAGIGLGAAASPA